MNSSRHRIIDGVEAIGNSLGLCSHLQEIVNSFSINDDISKEDYDISNDIINKSNSIRRSLMNIIRSDFNGDMKYRCALKHSIAQRSLLTEILYANKGNEDIEKLQDEASEIMYTILSKFTRSEISMCGRCFHDSILENENHDKQGDV